MLWLTHSKPANEDFVHMQDHIMWHENYNYFSVHVAEGN